MGNWLHRDCVLALTLPVMSLAPTRDIVAKYSKSPEMVEFLLGLLGTPGSKLIESPGGEGKTTDLIAT